MAIKKVTMQDIADACGLSRNTVSKIFNDRGAVPEATRRLVLQKAQEIGYRLIPEEALPAPEPQGGSIALLACNLPTEYHFCNFFVPAFAERFSAYGYTLTVYKITPDELRRRALPARLAIEQTAGIVAIEVFDRDYMDMVCNQGLPTLFVDAWAGASQVPVQCDMVYMENLAGIMAIVNQILGAGARKLGFVGDIRHCNSFWERWMVFRMALLHADVPLDERHCIIQSENQSYADPKWMQARLRQIQELPEAFVCANDYLAITLMTALKQLGLSVPGDVMVSGFDGQPQSAVVEPGLTTVQIPMAELGVQAAEILRKRIENRDLPLFTTYVKTVPVFRASTQPPRQKEG